MMTYTTYCILYSLPLPEIISNILKIPGFMALGLVLGEKCNKKVFMRLPCSTLEPLKSNLADLGATRNRTRFSV